MQFRKSLMTAAIAAMLQMPVAGMAQTAPQMPAMGDWSKGMGDWMTAMTNPQMMNSMMGMMDPKVMEPWMKAMTDPTQDPEHTVAPASGRCGNGGALQYFADMSRQTGIHSLLNSKTGKNSRVIGTTGNNNLSPLIQSLDKGLRPHLSDNANGLIHIRSVYFRYGVQRMNLALSELRLDRLMLDLRADDGHFKMKPLLRGNLFDNIHIPV